MLCENIFLSGLVWNSCSKYMCNTSYESYWRVLSYYVLFGYIDLICILLICIILFKVPKIIWFELMKVCFILQFWHQYYSKVSFSCHKYMCFTKKYYWGVRLVSTCSRYGYIYPYPQNGRGCTVFRIHSIMNCWLQISCTKPCVMHITKVFLTIYKTTHILKKLT